MKVPLRIAILECDTPLPGTKAKFGGYGGVFKQLLERAADALGHPGLSAKEGLELSYWPITTELFYPNLDDIDAILLTGSKFNSFDNDPWILRLVEFTEKVLAQDRVRTIGVCFGHQIVGRALGAKVGRSDAGWEVSVHAVDLTEEGKKLFKQDKLVHFPLSFPIYQMHRDIVSSFPPGVEHLATTDKCANQGMYQKNRLVTVQGHPEFTRDIVEEILKSRNKMGIFPEGLFEDGIRRLQDHDDGVIIAQAFLRFLLED
ncbi:class I glutamine amidotransferase-like protein [Microthyrium microscopicum]|uniref:Class I glutamine amidotransferase-like protein n=1 Tax=Microthyrium microscopicum TaxID=703497 RepID=A0A6A6UJX2_9PEZI|nr:class I glutamine amidotransferase-like protein [Microthyrium microscopicum]